MSTNTPANAIPAGYWKDARGVLTPESLVKPVDKERDALVKAIIERAKPLQQALRDFKQDTFADIQALIDLSAEQYGATIGGKKGNVTLYSYDGRFKVQRAMQDRIAFDERIQAAKELIDACVAEWTKDARPELLAIIDRAFSTDKEGEINPVGCCNSAAMRLPTRVGYEPWMRLPKLSRWSAVKAISAFMSASATPTNMCRSL